MSDTLLANNQRVPMVLRVQEIEEPGDVALREAMTEKEDFKELVESIRRRGILQPLLIRRENREGGEQAYVLADGLQRFTIACMLGLETVPCLVMDGVDQDDALELQIETNVHGVDTKPFQFAEGLRRLIEVKKRTLGELAKQLSKSEGWIKTRLGLLTLEGEAAKDVDEGRITLSNAYALAKLAKIAPDRVSEWLDRARTDSPEKFCPDVLAEEKKIRGELRGQKVDAGAPEKVRKGSDIKAEAERARAALSKSPDDPYAKGFVAALNWVLSVDPVSVQAYNDARAERERLRAEKAAARAAKKSEDGDE